MTPTLWLSCHVDYACRHSGVCCRAGWPLPVETHVVPPIDAAVRDGRVTTIDGAHVWLMESAEAPVGMAGVLRQGGGGCVFHQPRPGDRPDGADGSASSPRHCVVHARLGSEALPSTCRHFPRVCLIDDRGVRVSLSHACPTAAAMLVDHVGPVEIVSGPPAVPGLPVPEGLDVRGALPPRLTDRVLMDLESLTAWEAHLVDILAGPSTWSAPVDLARDAVRVAVDRLAAWRPSRGPLTGVVRALGSAAGAPARGMASPPPAADLAWQAWTRAASACQPPWAPEPLPRAIEQSDGRWVAPVWHDAAPAVRRYLAARAFGAWIAWQSDAAYGLVAWLDIASGVLRAECARAAGAAQRVLDRPLLIEAVGQADRLLVHYADLAQLRPGREAGGY